MWKVFFNKEKKVIDHILAFERMQVAGPLVFVGRFQSLHRWNAKKK